MRRMVSEDHPRLCGNDQPLRTVFEGLTGSPPLVRERQKIRPFCRHPGGITPACAGTTSSTRVGVDRKKDHPRLCGNDVSSKTSSCDRRGSPPLVRERQANIKRAKDRFGITPACAGTTSSASSASSGCGDHPRLCGNDFPIPTNVEIKPGSPPLVRERLSGSAQRRPISRITPACAGTT